jgi:branched-subunit amino acid aminotransferase/4-amino-4-deoxychorismate lyase
MDWIYLQGQWVLREAGRVPVADRGFRYGDGVFETFRSWGGRFLRLEDHLERLRRTASFLEIPFDWGYEQARAVCAELLDRNGGRGGDVLFRLLLTRAASDGLWPEESRQGTFLVDASSLPSRSEAVTLAVVSLRQDADSPLFRHKTLNRLFQVLCRREAQRKGAGGALVLNGRAEVAETDVANLFWVKEGRIRTPALDCNILPGVIRGILVEGARRAKIPLEEGRWGLEDLSDAQELFLTNARVGLQRVLRLEGKPAGRGSPLGERFRELFDQVVREEAR